MKIRQRHFWMNDAHDKPLADRPLFIDGFAGGGGASEGIRLAIGRHVDIAINHDRDAIAMHMVNHPDTRHYCENIWNVDPAEVTEGREIAAAWFSPDCTHFSRARGSKPVSKDVRGLAQAILPWASMNHRVRPRIIFVENVCEFETWGPVDDSGRPIKARAGETFQLWACKLRELGYVVEWRVLTASDYGAPTTRKRLFIIARCDGEPIAWPAATHANPKRIEKERLVGVQAWRTAADIIDWSIPCPSIFLSREEGKRQGCNRPLADKTMARIAEGIRRYVIESPPFLVPATAGCVSALLVSYYGPRGESEAANHRGRSIAEPVATVTTENRFGLVVAPMVAAFVAKHFSGVTGVRADVPFPTITAVGTQNQVVAATLVKNNHGDKQAFAIDEPLRTVLAGATHHALVSAFLMRYFGTGGQWSACDSPTPTVTAKDRLALGISLIDGEPFQIVDIGLRMLTPRELFSAQGFRSDYDIESGQFGRPVPKYVQVSRCGNSVPPQFAEAVVRANLKGVRV